MYLNMTPSRSFAAVFTVGIAAATAIPQTHLNKPHLAGRDNGQCTGGPWVDPTYVGGYTEGTSIDFCETGYPTYAHPINTVTIWSTSEAVRGIQFGYDDPNAPDTEVYGTNSGEGITASTMTINYAAGELVTTAALFAPDGAMYLRGLTIETNQGQSVHGGVTQDNSEGIPYQLQDVGTGFLIGASGDYQPGIIDNLGLLFLDSPVASVTVTDLIFADGPAGTQGIAPEALAAQHFFNGDPVNNDTWSFSGSKAVTSTSTYQQSSTTTFGASTAIMISGSLFSIINAGDTTTFSWTQADASMTSTTTTEVDTLNWMQGGSLSPGTGITCDAVSGHGSGSFPYTSTVSVNLQDGNVWATYNEAGVLNIDSVSSTAVSCTPDNTPN